MTGGDAGAGGGITATSGLSAKGLAPGAVGLLGATIIGISCVAPAYTLTAALGPIVAKVGAQTPAVILAGFLPMLLVAFGYRELNRAMPDNGTSFTWATRAFGPWIGWLAGWGLVASTVLVLSNAAGIAVDFFYLMLAQLSGRPALAALAERPLVNVATCLAFMGLATFISYRGMEATKVTQYLLVGFQIVVLLLFGSMALYGASSGAAIDPLPPALAWFNPLEVPTPAALMAGLSLSIFIFWGWDVTLTMNEESVNARTTPGHAAAATVIITVLLYVLTATGSIAFAGLDAGPAGLGNPDIQRNVFLGLAGPVLGGLALLISVAVLSSAAASLQSTIVSPSRTLLAMAHYGALPAWLTRIHPRHRTPVAAIFASTATSSAFYAVMRFASEHVLWDTITALGIMICFYYSITAFAAVWYFRRSWFRSRANILYRLLCPLAGGVALFALFCRTITDSLDPGFGSGSHFHGIGLVFILGIGILGVGMLLMAVTAWSAPAFFRGETLATGAAD